MEKILSYIVEFTNRRYKMIVCLPPFWGKSVVLIPIGTKYLFCHRVASVNYEKMWIEMKEWGSRIPTNSNKTLLADLTSKSYYYKKEFSNGYAAITKHEFERKFETMFGEKYKF